MCLQVTKLSKAFATPVLRSISLAIAKGEIRGLVGENGAGKSTLLNILGGNVLADQGELALDGHPYCARSAKDALTAGVALATQELSVIETLSVAENLCLATLPNRIGVVDGAARDRIATDLLRQVGLSHLSPAEPADALTLAEQQLIEIARAASQGTRLLLLDEPTAALSSEQAVTVHDLIKSIATRGTAVVYVSHRLEDVKAVCDTISILRDGELIVTKRSNDISVEEMIQAMAGRFAQRKGRDRVPNLSGPVLVADEIVTDVLPYPISLELHAGEIVGLAGLAGSGRTELLRALMGLDRRRGGSLTRLDNGKSYRTATPTQAISAGIGYVPEDRKDRGIFARQNLAFNMSVASLRGTWLIPSKWITKRADEVRGLLKIRSAGLDQNIEHLSGGNQQKAILGRWLMRRTPILLLDEPGRGVDVAAKSDIFDEISRLADSGVAVLMASSDMDELTSTCDRICVMSGRRLAAAIQGPHWDKAAIMRAAFSAHVGDRADEINVMGPP